MPQTNQSCHKLFHIENGPITKNGKKASAVKRNVTTLTTETNTTPLVLIGSITSFLSLTVKEPAIANIKPIGRYRPKNIINPVDQFQNAVLAEAPK